MRKCWSKTVLFKSRGPKLILTFHILLFHWKFAFCKIPKISLHTASIVRISRPDVFCQNIHRKTPALESLFNKVLLYKKLHHRWFPVNIAKFLREAFCIEYLQWLLPPWCLNIFKHFLFNFLYFLISQHQP